jgi:tetratricopeptide (TPR) repeat protein
MRSPAVLRSKAVKMSSRIPGGINGLLAMLAAIELACVALAAREETPQFARVEVETGRENCAAELDSTPVGKTGATGKLQLDSVEPGDHYLHLECPGEQGVAYFISPRAGEKLELRHAAAAVPAAETPPSASQVAEVKLQLRQHIREAVELRSRGHIEEAVEHLRSAFRLDPDNSDLHREMGITFLLAKEWKRARVEMLEAIRHDPTDAEALNGLGYALEKMGDLQAAVEAYRTASKLEPNDPSYRRRYFSALGKLSELQAVKKK